MLNHRTCVRIDHEFFSIKEASSDVHKYYLRSSFLQPPPPLRNTVKDKWRSKPSKYLDTGMRIMKLLVMDAGTQ